MSVDIGDRIRRYREYKSLSQEQLAERIGVTKAHVSDMENGRKKPSFPLLKHLVDGLKIDARYLLGQLETPEEADIEARGDDPSRSRLERLAEKIDELTLKVRPAEKLDPVAERVMVNRDLRELVEMVQFFEAGTLRRFTDMAYAYVAGTKEAAGASRQTNSREVLGGRESTEAEQATGKSAAG